MPTIPVKTLVRQRITPMLTQTLRAVEQKQSYVVDPLMLLSEAVPMLGNPSYATLQKWIRTGALRVHRVGLRGHFRVRLSEIKRFRDAGEEKP